MVKAVVIVDGQFVGKRMFGSRQAYNRYREAVSDVTSHLLLDRNSGVFTKEDLQSLALTGCHNDHATIRLIQRHICD